MTKLFSRIYERARAIASSAADSLYAPPQTDRARVMMTDTDTNKDVAEQPEAPAATAASEAPSSAVIGEAAVAEPIEPSVAEDARAESEVAEVAHADVSDAAGTQSAEPASDPDPERLAADAARIRGLFAVEAEDGGEPGFRVARWTRPIRLGVYGAEPASAEAISAAVAEACAVAGASIVDPEASDAGGADAPNFVIYLCDAWTELADAPGLHALEPNLEAVLAGLEASDANQHRFFRVSPREGIVFAVTLLRLDQRLSAISGQAAALGQAARALALWSDNALDVETPIALRRSGRAAFKGWFARLLGALYAEGAPAYSEDAAYAEALALEIGRAPERQEGAKRRRGDKRKNAAQGAEAKADSGGEDDARRKRRRRRKRSDDGEAAPSEVAAASEPISTDVAEPISVAAGEPTSVDIDARAASGDGAAEDGAQMAHSADDAPAPDGEETRA